MKRHYENEIMDDFSIQDERIDEALKELNIINKFLGGNSVSEKGLKYFESKDEVVSILDMGSGGSDFYKSIKNNFNNLIYVSVDLNKRACKFNSKENKNPTVCGNAFSLPFKNKSFDFLHASLFLHHFNENEIDLLLNEFFRISKKGIIINDLHRSVFALISISILTKLFSKSEMVKHDAPLSVKRGFAKIEIIKILNNINCNFTVKWNWAFRWLVIIKL